jgi:thiol-disulfide isomerase/thioredoxin
MKNLISILILSLGLQLALAQGIDFFHGSFEEAKTEAKAQGKLIFMDAYAVWCGPCKMMTNKVFPQEKVGDFFNKNFINMKVDMEKGEGVDLRRQYGVSAYPTLLLIDGNGEVVQQIRGARDADGLIDWATKAALPDPGLTQKLQEKYDDGDRSPNLMRDLIKVKAAYNDATNSLMEEYINGLSEEEKVATENADFIFDQTNAINSLGLKVLKDYEEYFTDIKGADVLDRKISGIAKSSGTQAIKDGNKEQLDEVLAFLKEYKPANYKELSSELMVNFYGKNEDWSNYDKAVTKHLAKFKKGDDKSYRDVAWNYYMNIEDPASLKKAEQWMQNNIKASNSYENNLTQAYLLYKLKSFSEAEDAVNYALILAGEDKKTKNAQILKDQILKKLKKTETVE